MRTEEQFIRACKGPEPRDAVLELYRNEYLDTDTPYPYIAHILGGIVDKYQLISPSNLFNELSPGQEWLHVTDEEKLLPDNERYYIKSTSVFISAIRFSETGKFGDIFTKESGTVPSGTEVHAAD